MTDHNAQHHPDLVNPQNPLCTELLYELGLHVKNVAEYHISFTAKGLAELRLKYYLNVEDVDKIEQVFKRYNLKAVPKTETHD
jgi:hypothetical protein